MKVLRRLLSMLLLAVFGLAFVAPLMATAQTANGALPACCRRNGAHHCAMSMAERSQMVEDEGTRLRWKAPLERCPYCPASTVEPHAKQTLIVPVPTSMLTAMLCYSAGVVQTESKRRISLDRSRQKRGPPFSFWL